MTGFRFDSYTKLKRQVFNRIVDWINAGNMDDINYNVMVVALEDIDGIVSKGHEIYFNEDHYVPFEILAYRNDDFKDIFDLAADEYPDNPDMHTKLIRIWTLLFREVFIENYFHFRNRLNSRIVENGGI